MERFFNCRGVASAVRLGLNPYFQRAVRVLRGRPDSMAVRANDVALGNFCSEDRAVLQIDVVCGKAKGLRLGVTMVEVHDVRRKRTPAVHTGDSSLCRAARPAWLAVGA